MGELKGTCIGGDGGGKLRTITLLESRHLVGTECRGGLRFSFPFSVLSSQSHQRSHVNGAFLTTEQGPIVLTEPRSSRRANRTEGLHAQQCLVDLAKSGTCPRSQRKGVRRAVTGSRSRPQPSASAQAGGQRRAGFRGPSEEQVRSAASRSALPGLAGAAQVQVFAKAARTPPGLGRRQPLALHCYAWLLF